MAITNLSLILGCSTILYLLYTHIFHPLFLSPLSKIPAPHWSCHISPAWMTYLRWRGPENKTIYLHHVEKGPILRTGPKELSVNSYEGLKAIYGGGFEKHEFYARFENYGLQPMFATKESAPHSFRKRMVANIFSKSNILTSPTVSLGTQHVLLSRFLPVLQTSAERQTPLNIVTLNYAYFMDSFTSFQFGLQNGSNLIQNTGERDWYLDSFLGVRPYLFWSTTFPRLSSFLTNLGLDLAPSWLRTSAEELWAWNLRLCDQAEEAISSFEAHGDETSGIADVDQPVVYKQMRDAMRRADAKLAPEQWPRDCQDLSPQPYARRLETATDMFDFNAAAQETSGITLTYACWQLSQRPKLMEKLREELLSLSPPLVWAGKEKSRNKEEKEEREFATPKSIDALPLLDAILQETLRLHAAVPGGAPRLTPAQPTTLGGYSNIPAGTRVQSSAYTLHRNSDVFPEPHEWRPQRWLESSDAQLREMRRWFWAWGSGGRMCVGSHFATHSMKLALAAIYTNFWTEIVDDYGGLPQLDAFIAGPESGKLLLQFHRV